MLPTVSADFDASVRAVSGLLLGASGQKEKGQQPQYRPQTAP